MIDERKNIILNITNNNSVRSSEKYFIRNYNDVYEIISNHFLNSNLNKDILFKEKIWLWVHDTKDLPKCSCGNYTKINPNWLDGFRRNCSVKCSSIDQTRIENAKKSTKEKYGSENYFNTEDYKEKVKKSNLEKYGVDHYSKTDEYKEKIKKTNLERYGTDHYSKTDEYKEKVKNTSINKYGVDNYAKSDAFKLKRKKHTIPKSKYDKLFSKYPTTPSFNEISYKSYIETIYTGEIIPNYRDGFEIDIYLPELKIGFEFNDLEHKDKNYHLYKTNHFKDKGIRIIHIWEDDWNFKCEIIKSQIKNLLKLNTIKIFSRKCIIKEVDVKETRKFLDDNHIQGFVNSKIKLGLYYNDELVSLMTFDKYEGRKIMTEQEWNLNRFCNKLNTNVIGSASKLLKHFIKEYKPNRIISYADKDWSIGDLYYKLGFDYINETPPDYKYIVNKKRIHKSNYKKSKLKTDLTENEQMKLNSINKIYDCGKIKFQLINI